MDKKERISGSFEMDLDQDPDSIKTIPYIELGITADDVGKVEIRVIKTPSGSYKQVRG